jgi:hypothetical protein
MLMHNLYNKLGIRYINEYEYNSINTTVKENYKIKGNISYYNPNIDLLTNYFKKTNSFNNTHKLIRLKKKKNRIQTIGYTYKALIKHKNKTYFTNVFIKELPIFNPDNIDLLKLSKNNICSLNTRYNNIVYNKNSTTNVEIFVNYLVSKIQENFISPSFCKFYGCYLVNMDNYTYNVSDTPEFINSQIIDKSTFYNGTYLQLNNVYTYLLATEKADYDIDFLKKTNTIDYNMFISFVFQIFSAIININKIFGIKHNDLHLGNIMVTNTKKQFLYYKLNNIIFKVPTFGYIVKIIDWGRATYNFKGLIGKNSVFNYEGECFGQYVYNNIKGKKSSELLNNQWSDMTIVSHNLLYEFPEFRLSGIGKLLINNITNTMGDVLDFNVFNWSTYRNIGKNKYTVKPKSIIKNRIFNKYRCNTKDINQKIYTIYL